MQASDIQIRAESPHEITAVAEVTAAAFLDAPHTSHTEQFIVGALRRAGKLAVSRVAIQHGKVIGHVAVSPVLISGADLRWYGLGPVSVLPSHQRRGIGSALVMDALLVLSGAGATGCVVLGEPSYYGRFGFKANDALVLPGVPPANFMAVQFDSSMPSGTVTYHEAFQARS